MDCTYAWANNGPPTWGLALTGFFLPSESSRLGLESCSFSVFSSSSPSGLSVAEKITGKVIMNQEIHVDIYFIIKLLLILYRILVYVYRGISKYYKYPRQIQCKNEHCKLLLIFHCKVTCMKKKTNGLHSIWMYNIDICMYVTNAMHVHKVLLVSYSNWYLQN